ncbi:shikimate dehydrogenase [Trueperella sp. LYQ141]|uniref:shikimate dehydrogenase n=1 Tax=Trueperella sp. LYQ141 TaxID=3391058 RepID=UPI0039838D8F
MTHPSLITSGHTQLLALIGMPARHSKSPLLHSVAFAVLGIDAAYVVHELDTPELSAAFAGIRALGYRGGNLTMPHKTAAMPLMDHVSMVATLMQAINTFTLRDGELWGDNTDGAGMLNALRRRGAQIEDTNIVVLGVGGAARAIWTQAALDGARHIFVINRDIEDRPYLRAAIEQLREHCDTEISLIDSAHHEQVAYACEQSAIIINATSVGMGKMAGISPIHPAVITPQHIVADAVYYPRQTALLQAAHERGAQTVEGLHMLIEQAALCEQLWFGVDMPRDVVEAVLFREEAE